MESRDPYCVLVRMLITAREREHRLEKSNKERKEVEGARRKSVTETGTSSVASKKEVD